MQKIKFFRKPCRCAILTTTDMSGVKKEKAAHRSALERKIEFF
jgi:hypothetical protein